MDKALTSLLTHFFKLHNREEPPRPITKEDEIDHCEGDTDE